MRIAVASGKGGTGKTTVAVNLALSLERAQLVDCDVEEPNCHLFLGLDTERVRDVSVRVPVVEEADCDLCGDCARFCRYHALAVVPGRMLVFENLCHGCGGCQLVCPRHAITERDRPIGRVDRATTDGLVFYRGVLDVGEAMATPVISALRETVADSAEVTILDAPPGTACPMIETVRGCDYCVLVTEPTPFGLHDLTIAVAVVRYLGVPLGVVINRDGSGDDAVARWCADEHVPVIMRIPHDRRIAELYSEGTPFSRVLPGWREEFGRLFERIRQGATS